MRVTRLSLLAAPLFLLFTACPGGGGSSTKTDPCEGVLCGAGICVQNGTAPQCICNANYEPKNNTCVPIDACASDPCASSGKVCQSVNGVASCSCPSGFVDQGNGCVQKTACSTNTCTGAHQTVCTVDTATNTAVCSCDTGYLPLNGGCVADPFQDCSKSHSGGTLDDQYEPNECPRDATPVTLDVSQDFTLGPAGDEDWLKLSTTEGHIVQLDLSGSTTGLYIDVFAADAVTGLASSHSGLSAPSLKFRAPNGDAIYVRVKALSASATTSYSVFAHDLGPDDFANTDADALTLTPTSVSPITVSGDIQYDGDVDFIKVGVQQGHSYRLTLGSATATGIQVEVLNPDGTLRKTMDETLTANLTHFLWPTQSGTYLVKAKAETPGLTGAFSLTIDDLGVDDHADLALDAQAITPTASPTGSTFERSGDTDVFKFSVTAGHIYKFTCQPSSTSSYGCVIVLRDDAGTVLTQTSTSYPSTAGLTYEAQAAGTWNASVQNYYSSYTGAYTYKLEDLGADDYGDTPATANAITVGTPVNGNIEVPADHDVFSITASANHIYQVTCTSSSYYLCNINVRDASGTSVASSSYGSSTSAGFRALASGTYTIDIYGSSSYSGTYQVTVTDTGTDDHGDTAATATALTAGTPTAGNIQFSGDHDFFSISTTASHSYQVSCTTSASYLCYLVIRDPSGTSTTTSYGTSVSTGFLSAGGGTYTIETYAYYSGYTGAYTLTVTDTGVDDHGNTAATATDITSASTSGNIQYSGDHDFLDFTATANHIYTVGCTSSGSYLCYLNVRDPSGVSVGSSSYGSSTTVNFVANSAGRYTIETYAYSSNTGTYAISVTDQGADDHGNTAATATALTVGTPTSGNIQYSGDHDFFSVSTTINRIYTVSCSTSASYLCYMVVRDPNGVSVSTTSYGSSVTTTFGSSAGGTYTIETYSYYSGYTGAYSITVTDAGADDHGNTAATATALTSGTPTSGNIQYSGDHDFFSISTTANHIYQVSCSTSASYLCYMIVRDPSGTNVVTTSYGSSVTTTFGSTSGGTYTIETYSYYTGYTGTYSITVTDTGTDDFGNTPGTATAITVGTPANGNIQFNGDHDVMSFSVTANKIYKVSCTSSTTYLCNIVVRDASGVSVGSSSYGTSTSVLFKAASAGTFTADTYAYSTYTGTYTLTVTDQGTDDFGDTPATASTITVGSPVNGNIQYGGDKDVFAFTATTNHIYRFTCSTSASSLCVLTARDAAGTTVASASYSTSNSVTFLASSAQVYSVEVKGYSTSYTGAYTVQLFDDGADDHGNTAATGTAITSGGSSLSGNIQYSGDKDVFTFSATAGRIYTFNCQTTATYVCNLVARDPNGTSVATVTYGANVNAVFKATTNGTYSVEVGTYSTGYTGTYTVALTDAADDYGDTYQTAGSLSVGVPLNGTLEVTGDVDYFAVNLNASTTYTVTVPTQGGQYFYIAIYSTNGTTTIGTTTYSSRTFTTTVAGTYYIKVYPYYSQYPSPYTITIQ